MKFADSIPAKLPYYYVRNKLEYDFVDPLRFAQPYFMLPLSNNLYSLRTGDSIALPLQMDPNDFSQVKDGKATFGTEILGLVKVGTVMHILYQDAKYFRFARYDLAANKLLQDTPIPGVSRDKIDLFPAFDGPFHVVYCRRGSKSLIRETLPVLMEKENRHGRKMEINPNPNDDCYCCFHAFPGFCTREL